MLEYGTALFCEDQCEDFEQLRLTLFLMKQYSLGMRSRYFPYIQCLPDIDECSFFCDWPEKVKMETQDEELVQIAVEFKLEVDL